MSETLNKKIINQTKIEQIKIPENQLQKLNRFIEKNLQNRKMALTIIYYIKYQK